MNREEFTQLYEVDDKIRKPDWNEHEYLQIKYIGKKFIFAEDEKGNEMDWEIDEDWERFDA
jgi:hypothetical protein